MSSLQIKLDDVEYAVSEGADEIDMVISRGAFYQVSTIGYTMKLPKSNKPVAVLISGY